MHGRHLFAKLGLFALLGVQLAPAQTVPENPALGRLLHAAMFALGPVGYAGQTSPEERDYRQILAQPNALASFEELFARGNKQAKSYALAGMRQLSPARFRELYATLPDPNAKVHTMHGCIVSDETLRQVALSLASSSNPGE
ncbi:MAG TPA: hypothetical protein VKV02_13005 [Acidobacteriaceae bacterium]|nr:hypothetical protein [Acidobacteriaceae bacterium]